MLFHPMRWQSEENVGLAEAAEWARHFGQLEQDMDALLAQLFGVDPEIDARLDQSGPLCFGPRSGGRRHGRAGRARPAAPRFDSIGHCSRAKPTAERQRLGGSQVRRPAKAPCAATPRASPANRVLRRLRSRRQRQRLLIDRSAAVRPQVATSFSRGRNTDAVRPGGSRPFQKFGEQLPSVWHAPSVCIGCVSARKSLAGMISA